MGRKPTPDHSIDRIDVDGNYCKENCRWATDIEQANNKRKRLRLDQFSTEELLAELAKRNAIKLPRQS